MPRIYPMVQHPNSKMKNMYTPANNTKKRKKKQILVVIVIVVVVIVVISHKINK